MVTELKAEAAEAACPLLEAIEAAKAAEAAEAACPLLEAARPRIHPLSWKSISSYGAGDGTRGIL